MIINLEIIRYFDLDFAGCLDNRRSTFSYVFMLAKGDVSWKSVKQSIIATFTMEAKFIACYKVSNQAIWLQNFISGLRIVDGIERPLRIKLYSKNNRSSLKSKHIDLKFLVVKERVQSFQVSIKHTSTNFTIADSLTKGVPPKLFHEHVARMAVVHLSDICLYSGSLLIDVH